MKIKLIPALLASLFITGCSCANSTSKSSESSTPSSSSSSESSISTHEHTFDGSWTTNETSHWHTATCGHNELVKDLGDHIDNDKNHLCDVCSKELSTCLDSDNDHLCDLCKKPLSNHIDEDKDHICDICEELVSSCKDDNNDNHCDICEKIIDITKEAVNKEYFKAATDALKGNFKAEISDGISFVEEKSHIRYGSKSWVEHEKNDVYHAKELLKDFIRTIDIKDYSEEISSAYGDSPSEEQINEFVSGILKDNSILVDGFYYTFRDSDEIIHEEGSDLYSIKATQTDSIGSRFDVINNDMYYSADYVDLYYINHEDIYSETLTLGKQGHYIEYDDFDGYNLFYFLSCLTDKLELASYDKDEKIFTFSGSNLANLLMSDPYQLFFPGSFWIGNYGGIFQDGKLEIDFTDDNKLDCVSLILNFDSEFDMYINLDFTFGGEEIEVPQFDDVKCDHPEQYLRLYKNANGHYLECNKCNGVASYSKHSFDSNGTCTICGYQQTELRTIFGEKISGYRFNDIYLKVNPATEEIISIGAPYSDGYAKYSKHEFGDLSKFEGVSDFVWAPFNYDSLDTFYVLDNAYEEVTIGCCFEVIDRYAVYKIENGVASLFIGPIYSRETAQLHNITFDAKKLEKIENGVFKGTCYCSDCGKEFDGYCFAFLNQQASDDIDTSYLSFYFSYYDENHELHEPSGFEMEPHYDKSGFDYFTGKHALVSDYAIEGYDFGHLYHETNGDVSFGGLVPVNCTRSFDGATEVYTLNGTPEGTLIQARLDFDMIKDPDTCLSKVYQYLTFLYNGEIYDYFESFYYPSVAERIFDHNLEYVEGSYRFDENLSMYVCEAYCPNCKRTLTIYNVEVEYIGSGRHSYKGISYEVLDGNRFEIKVNLEEDCINDPLDTSKCSICGNINND